MARTVNQQVRDERRAAILAAAVEIFARQGLEATRLAQVGEAVGVTHPTILNYFGTKDALFAAAVLEPLEQFEDDLWPREGEALGSIVGRHVGMFMAQGSYLRLAQYVLTQQGRFPELAAELRLFVERLRDVMAPMLVDMGETHEGALWRFWGYFSQLFGMAMVMDDTPAVRRAMTERACYGMGVEPPRT